jgi:UDP-3-O-acyl-N-acetylglucosamine deacetylase
LKLQKTIKSEGRIAGKGMFGGVDVQVTFKPAAANTGVVFVRTDAPERVQIKASPENIAERSRRTAIKKGAISIETVEHCMAAIYGMEIDNILIEVEGPELPAPDCSSEGFLSVLKELGTIEQQSPRKEVIIREPINIVDGDATIYALPCT